MLTQLDTIRNSSAENDVNKNTLKHVQLYDKNNFINVPSTNKE